MQKIETPSSNSASPSTRRKKAAAVVQSQPVTPVAVTKVTLVRAPEHCVCAAGCDNPLISVGNMRRTGQAVAVNVAIGPDGKDLPPDTIVEGAKWARLETYHVRCYETLLQDTWGPPQTDTSKGPLSVRQKSTW